MSSKETKPLEWYAIYADFDTHQVKTYNIFRHGSFLADVTKAAKKYKSDREEFLTQLRRSLMYYFWSKAEWEVLVYPWLGRIETPRKIDVCWQVMNNWDVFSDYVCRYFGIKD